MIDETEIEVDIKCPWCSALTRHKYTKSTYTTMFGKCWFCQGLFKWKKSSTIKIVPVDKMLFITLIDNSLNE